MNLSCRSGFEVFLVTPVISWDLSSIAACLRACFKPEENWFVFFFGFVLADVVPGFSPHRVSQCEQCSSDYFFFFGKFCWNMAQKVYCAETWLNQVYMIKRSTFVVIWSFYRSLDGMEMALMTKFWLEERPFSLVITRGVLLWNCCENSVSGFIFEGFRLLRFEGCLWSLIIFYYFALSPEISQNLFSIFLDPQSMEGSSWSIIPRSSST